MFSSRDAAIGEDDESQTRDALMTTSNKSDICWASVFKKTWKTASPVLVGFVVVLAVCPCQQSAILGSGRTAGP